MGQKPAAAARSATFRALLSGSVSGFVLPAAVTAVPAFAQEQAPSIEEVIVTAQKREERLQDVPISISVLRGQDLDRTTAQGMNEILSRVPGVSFDAVGSASGLGQGGPGLGVRGVTAPSSFNTGASPIGYY